MAIKRNFVQVLRPSRQLPAGQEGSTMLWATHSSEEYGAQPADWD